MRTEHFFQLFNQSFRVKIGKFTHEITSAMFIDHTIHFRDRAAKIVFERTLEKPPIFTF